MHTSETEGGVRVKPPELVQYHECGSTKRGKYGSVLWEPRRSRGENDSLFCRHAVLIEKIFGSNVMGKSSENGQNVKILVRICANQTNLP